MSFCILSSVPLCVLCEVPEKGTDKRDFLAPERNKPQRCREIRGTDHRAGDRSGPHSHPFCFQTPGTALKVCEFPQVGLRTLALQRIPRTEKGVVGRPLLVTELFSCHCGGGEAGRCQKVRPVPRQCVITGFASNLTESRSRNSLPGWRPAAGYTILHSPREKKHGKKKSVPFPGSSNRSG